MGIRGQLALIVPALVAVFVVAVVYTATERSRRQRTEEVRERREQVLQAIGVTAAVYVAQNDMAGLDALIAHVTARDVDPDLRELAVLDEEGRVLAHSTPSRFNELMSDEFTRSAIASDRPAWLQEGRELRIAVPAVSGLRWATVTGRFSLDRVLAAVESERTWWMTGGLLTAVVLALALYVALERLVVRPVQALRTAAKAMGGGRLDATAPVSGGREVSELGAAFNKMAAALKKERESLEATVSDRTRELREANTQLEKLAVTDGLTGIYNHRRFQEALSQEVLRAGRTGHPLSVLMIDVDHFKRFNDTMGHPAGDALLRQLATTLSKELRATDFLSRYGGEEFAILLPDTTKEKAMEAAERVRASVERELNPDESRPRVSVSIGVATFNYDGDAAQKLLSAADKALYAAKHSGRNRVVAAGGAA